MSQPTCVLADRTLNASELADLCTELLSPASRLRELKLYNNTLTDEAVEALAQGISGNEALTHLQIRKNGVTDRGAAALGEALSLNPGIMLLSLRDNKISDVGAAALARGIASGNVTLHGVSLRENRITTAGAAKMINVLLHHRNLRGVALYDNLLDPKSIKKLEKRGANSAVSFEVTRPLNA